MWFENSFRRHLLDMHIADWGDGRFLSKFSPEEYCNNLKRANIKSAMIYLQSHVGYCYYPTKTGHMHPAFNDDPGTMKRLIDLCHKNGIDVVAYYSINYNSIERNNHPEWSLVKAEGAPAATHMFSGARYGHCCPMNPEYLQFALDQTTEILEYADIDGLFYDMPFWANTCYCDHCKARYKKETGLDIPKESDVAAFDAFIRHREKWTDEYIGKISAHIRKLRPNVSVQFNYAYSALDTVDKFASEVINKHQDYASGDIYVKFLIQSFACKYYNTVTNNKPFEFMTGRCDPGLRVHTITKSHDKLRLANMLTMAHHGANFIIDAIDPIGTMDKRFYEFLGEINKEIEHYEPYLKTGEMMTDAAIMYIMEGRTNRLSGRPVAENCHYNAVISTSKLFIQNHIPHTIISQATAKDLEKYKVIMLPNPNHLNENTVAKLKSYVEQGGILYVSGAEQLELLELMGTECIGTIDYADTYIAPKKAYEELFADFNAEYPLAFKEKLPDIKPVPNGEVLATVTLPYIHPEYPDAYASIHSNPPGTPTDYPAVVIKNVGKGTILWSAPIIEAKTPLVYQTVLLNLLKKAGFNGSSIRTTATRNTELVAFSAEDQTLVSAVYLTDDEVTEPQRPFEISIKTKKPQKVTLLRNDKEIAFTYKDGYTTFTTDELNIFDMYQIKY